MQEANNRSEDQVRYEPLLSTDGPLFIRQQEAAKTVRDTKLSAKATKDA
jgi:hypothetical protein